MRNTEEKILRCSLENNFLFWKVLKGIENNTKLLLTKK